MPTPRMQQSVFNRVASRASLALACTLASACPADDELAATKQALALTQQAALTAQKRIDQLVEENTLLRSRIDNLESTPEQRRAKPAIEALNKAIQAGDAKAAREALDSIRDIASPESIAPIEKAIYELGIKPVAVTIKELEHTGTSLAGKHAILRAYFEALESFVETWLESVPGSHTSPDGTVTSFSDANKWIGFRVGDSHDSFILMAAPRRLFQQKLFGLKGGFRGDGTPIEARGQIVDLDKGNRVAFIVDEIFVLPSVQ